MDLAAIDAVYSFLDRPRLNSRANTPLFPPLTIADEVEEEEDVSRRRRITSMLERLAEEGAALTYIVRGTGGGCGVVVFVRFVGGWVRQ